jgi:hypothetical protein
MLPFERSPVPLLFADAARNPERHLASNPQRAHVPGARVELYFAFKQACEMNIKGTH